MSPTARTIQYFKGLDCAVVKLEYYHKWARKTMDVWGADILVRQGQLGLAIQATDDSHHAHRVAKALNNPLVANWLKMGINFYVYSWGLKGGRGKRKLWAFRVTQIILDDKEKLRVL